MCFMEQIKLLKVAKGEEARLAEEAAKFYNRMGRIGNRCRNAKLLFYADGSIGMTIPYTENKVDDGRQIDDIEDRKSFCIYRTDGTDIATVNEFLKAHREAGDDVSSPYIDTVGNETVYFVAATKVPQIDDPWQDEDGETDEENEEDDGEPVMVSMTIPDISASSEVDDPDPFA